MTEMEREMATMFEATVRAAIHTSGLSYTQLSKEAKVDGTAIGRFMSGERGLNSETLGRILDTLGCTLTPVINRFAPKPVGRPRKQVYRGKSWDVDIEKLKGEFVVTQQNEVYEIEEEEDSSKAQDESKPELPS
jgi:ribosome-binding protein aMBF1 (putative translation factor)